MAASNGPDQNSFQIPEVALGDTFNVWRDATNTSIYKLNKLRIYRGVSSASIELVTDAGGTLTANLADNVNKGVTFIQPVSFESGVTFNGEVTFNAPRFTVNAQMVTIDDFNLVLGDTGAPDDAKIENAGGGGLLLRRGSSGNTAEWVWRAVQAHGVTGVWRANTHIGFSGATSGLYPENGGVLRIHGSGVRVDGGLTSEHGLQVNLSTTGVNGTTSGRAIQFSRYSPAGSTVFMEVLSGPTYGSRPFVSVRDGANRKTVLQTGHGFAVGTPVRYTGTAWAAAKADNAANAEVVGVVSRVDGNEFEITYIGDVVDVSPSVIADGASLVPGAVYYLSPSVLGKVVSTAPTSAGSVHKAVFLATSSTTATVIPWTGGVISSPVQLSYATSLSQRIMQLNKFKAGEIVRFKAGSNTNLNYPFPPTAPSGSTSATYAHGVYVKAQANTAEEAEVAGFITSVSEIIDGLTATGVNSSFDILMDGYFDIAGISATTNGVDGTLVPGNVYFLRLNCAGTSRAFESQVPSLSNQSPTGALEVRKPMLFAVSPSSGYLFSYRGDVQGLSGLCASVALENLLIRNLNSGICGDLVFGLYSGVVGGTPVMHFPLGATGNIVVGPYSGTGYTSGATFEVYGGIRAGTRAAATDGGIIIAGRHNSDTGAFPVTLNVFGSEHSTGNSVIGYGVRPNVGAAGFLSTTTTNIPRVVLEVGSGGNSTPSVSFLGAGQQTTAVGSAVTTTEFFTANTTGATFAGTVDAVGVARFASGVTFAGTSDHSGVARFTSGVTFAGTSDHSGVARFTSGVTFSGTVDAVGVARFASGVTFAGGVSMSGNLSVANNLNVDSGTLVVDAANNRVGVNKAAPAYDVDVTGSGNISAGLTVGGRVDAGNIAVSSGKMVIGSSTLSNNHPLQVAISSANTTLTNSGNYLLSLVNSNTTVNNYAMIAFNDALTSASSAAVIGAKFTDHTSGNPKADLVLATRNPDNTFTEGLVLTSGNSVAINSSTAQSRLYVFDGSIASAPVFQGQGNRDHTYKDVITFNTDTLPANSFVAFILPKSLTTTMLDVTIDGYAYSPHVFGHGGWTIRTGAYVYNTGSIFLNTYAHVVHGDCPFDRVKWHYSTTYDRYVLILGPFSKTGNYNYTYTKLSEVRAMYSSTTGWGSGWTGISFSSEPASLGLTTSAGGSASVPLYTGLYHAGNVQSDSSWSTPNMVLGGTASSGDRLDIHGSLNVRGNILSSSNTTTVVGVSSGNSSSYAEFRMTNNLGHKGGVWINGSAVSSYGGGSSVVLWNNNGATLSFGTNNATQMTLTGSKLGIGTSSPNSTVDVVGSIRATLTGSPAGPGTESTHYPLYVQSDKERIGIFLAGDASSTLNYKGNSYSSAIRFNGAGVAWGDFAYFPQGRTAGFVSGAGEFRFSKAGTTLVTTANAMVSVGDLFSEGQIWAGATGTFAANALIRGSNSLLFADSDSSHVVGFKAPSTITTNRVWTLPAADGINGYVLSTDGGGTLSWKAADGVTGTDKQVQYNQSGIPGATASFVFEYASSAGFSAGTLGVSGGAYVIGNMGVGVSGANIGRRIVGGNTYSAGKLEVRGDIRIPSGGFFVNTNITIPAGLCGSVGVNENAMVMGTMTVSAGATMTVESSGRLIVM